MEIRRRGQVVYSGHLPALLSEGLVGQPGSYSRPRAQAAGAFVLWGGLLVYTAYYYVFYAFDHVMTVVYPLYIALIGAGRLLPDRAAGQC